MKRPSPAPESQRRARQRCRQYIPHVRRNVVLPRIEQILQVQPGFRLPLHRQPPLEEQRIRILASRGERDEIRQCSAQRDVRRERRAREAAAGDLEGQCDRNILHAQLEPLAVKFVEPFLERLATQQLIHCQHQQALVQWCGRDSQPEGERSGRVEHEDLRIETSSHSCHVRRRTGLILLNRDMS